MRELDRSTWPNHELSRFVEAGGIRWHVQQSGSGPPLLLVHGTGASTHSWRDLVPLLAQGHSVLAADLPGHGLTDPAGAAQSSISGMSGLLAALLRTLRISPRYCVGHSAGAVILCRMALDGLISPNVIVSINGAFMPLGGMAGLLYAPIARMMARSPLLSGLIARRARDPLNIARILAGTGSNLDAAGIEFYARLLRDPQHLSGVLCMMANWDLSAFRRDLPRLTTPLALLAADNDRTVPPRQASQVKEIVAHAAVYRVAGLGHLAHEEQPLLVAQQILKICGSAP